MASDLFPDFHAPSGRGLPDAPVFSKAQHKAKEISVPTAAPVPHWPGNKENKASATPFAPMEDDAPVFSKATRKTRGTRHISTCDRKEPSDETKRLQERLAECEATVAAQAGTIARLQDELELAHQQTEAAEQLAEEWRLEAEALRQESARACDRRDAAARPCTHTPLRLLSAVLLW